MKVETCDKCKGTGCAEGTTPEICPDCKRRGSVTRTARTPFGMMQTQEPCSRCGGTGKIIHQPCPTCKGKGKVRRSRRIKVDIPAGIDDGQTISLRGLGNAGRNGGPAGDLLVTVSVRSHPQFEREGTSILYELPVSIVQASLGAEVEVPTIDGKVKYTVPEGTQSGTVFRLRGKGSAVHGGGRGDQFVTVRVVTPKNLTVEQKDLLRKLGESLGDYTGVSPKKKKHLRRKINAAYQYPPRGKPRAADIFPAAPLVRFRWYNAYGGGVWCVPRFALKSEASE